MEKRNQITENIKLALTLKENGVKKLNLSSWGNSIASSYSMAFETKPLLERNTTLEEILKDHGITLQKSHFARFENNNDENVFEWLITSKTQRDINQDARVDDTWMAKQGRKLTEEELEKYYPETEEQAFTMQDILREKGSGISNIIIYNGATGSFLDNNTRGGKLSHRLMHGVKRDCTSIEAVLKYIQILNRNYQTNTQVYLCGSPNLGKLPISSMTIDPKLRKMAKNYANVVYVPYPEHRFLYHTEDGKTALDIHYDETDYHNFQTHLIHSINENYAKTKNLIELDRSLLQESRNIEASRTRRSEEWSYDFVGGLIKEHCQDLERQGQNPVSFLKRAKSYLQNRSPYDFYYIGQKNVAKYVK